MDLRQLRYFAQIVESGSLTKAARSLSVAQPALSQQLAKLEDEVGRSLFERTARGVTPTENGLALYHHARFMLRQLDQAVKIARQDLGGLQGPVSIGLPSTTVAALGLPLVKAVMTKHPGIMLNVVEGMSGHLGQLMRAGQLDLAILFSKDVSVDLHAEELLDEELFVIFPAHSPLVEAGRNALTLAEVASIPLILPTGSHGLRHRIAATFDARNLSPTIVAEIDSLSLLLDCVREGMGATIKPMSALHLERTRREDWRALPISDTEMKRRNYLYSIEPSRLFPAAVAVVSELRETTYRLVKSGDWRGVALPD